MSEFDVIVIGGGIVGATAACALGAAGARVALVEAHAPQPAAEQQPDPRVFAISRASEQVFRSLGVWDGIVAGGAFAFTDMEVWDAGGSGVIHFDCAEMGEPCLGHIIEPRFMLTALLDRLQALSAVALFCPAQFLDIQVDDVQATVTLQDQRSLSAGLLVAADGARSRVRDALGIQTRSHDYRQSSLVALVRTAEPHRDTAWQRFLPGGPLAFLPMHEGWSSIVWTMPTAETQRILELDRETFHAELAAAFDYRLGAIIDSGVREAWPLRRMHADHYVVPRAALIGDAAHAIHPLAGQGVNLGLLDAAALAQVVIEARAQHRDPGKLRVLRRYERWRRGDNLLMMSAMDGINQLFSTGRSPLGWVRNTGLSLLNRSGPARRLFMRHAMGLGGDLPELARHSPASESTD
jgi:2-octaprenylphenol hydroxylase